MLSAGNEFDCQITVGRVHPSEPLMRCVYIIIFGSHELRIL